MKKFGLVIALLVSVCLVGSLCASPASAFFFGGFGKKSCGTGYGMGGYGMGYGMGGYGMGYGGCAPAYCAPVCAPVYCAPPCGAAAPHKMMKKGKKAKAKMK